MGEGAPPPRDEDPQRTIEHLQEEIARLRERLDDDSLGSRLRDVSTTAAAAIAIGASTSFGELFELIVETAIDVLSASAGSLLLLDEDTNELVFEVAVGGASEEVRRLRIPLGHGIAGGVAVSGQPLAVAHVEEDPRWAADVGERVGYRPTNLLCVPLFSEDRVIGVLELLDKRGAPSFTAGDIHTLSAFATMAAITIEQSRTQRNVGALIAAVLASPDAVGARWGDELRRRLHQFGGMLEGDPVFRDSLELAHLVQTIARAGEDELVACRKLLHGFADYVAARRRLAGGDG
jgi:GAF domain-containing protein